MPHPPSAPIPWRHAVVVGASSGIGEAIARRLVAAGVATALVARRGERLAALARELNDGRPVALARPWEHDVADTGGAAPLVDEIARTLGGLDLVVYAAGIMPRVQPDEYDLVTDAEIVAVNLVGAMAWLDAVAPRLAAAGAGTIVGISSVSGDRGRRAYPAYAASKAGLTTYLESLRNRLAARGVTVVTAKPGPVDTPMTHGLDRLPFLVGADAAAAAILRAAARGRSTVYVPARWRFIMAAIRAIPSAIFRRLDL